MIRIYKSAQIRCDILQSVSQSVSLSLSHTKVVELEAALWLSETWEVSTTTPLSLSFSSKPTPKVCGVPFSPPSVASGLVIQ